MPKSDYFRNVKNRLVQLLLVGILALCQLIPIWESHCLNKQRHWIKGQIRNQFISQSNTKLDTIFVSQSEFSSLEKGDEIDMGIHRYDIISVKKVSNGWMAIAFNDRYEKELLVRISDDFKKGAPSDLTKKSFLKLVFFIEELPQVQFYIPREQKKWVIQNPHYSYIHLSESFQPPEKDLKA
jgi:hypothetical protein